MASSGQGPLAGPSESNAAAEIYHPRNDATGTPQQAKKKKHRGRKRRNRRQSFAASSVTTENAENVDPNNRPSAAGSAGAPLGSSSYANGQLLHRHPEAEESNLATHNHNQTQSQFYQLGKRATQSSESLDSEVLLDHREQEQALHGRPRRSSIFASQTSRNIINSRSSPAGVSRTYLSSSRSNHRPAVFDGESDEEDDDGNERTPLISHSPHPPNHRPTSKKSGTGYGGLSGSVSTSRYGSRPPRRGSDATSISQGARFGGRGQSTLSLDHDVNNPPSVPGSPHLGSVDDHEIGLTGFQSSPNILRTRDTIINIDHDAEMLISPNETAKDPYDMNRRRHTLQEGMEDVCLPFDQMTDILEEDVMSKQGDGQLHQRRRKHKRHWPDLEALEEWARQENEVYEAEGVTRAKKVNEPMLVDGRLRPRKGNWRREEEEAPFRWTYFNEELDESLKAHSLTGLQKLGLSFRELFVPDCPILEGDSSDEEEDIAPSLIKSPSRTATPVGNGPGGGPGIGGVKMGTRQPSIIELQRSSTLMDRSSEEHTPSKEKDSWNVNGTAKRYGPRPVFWLDVLEPTYEEMRVISRAFGIHKLTAEDIMEQEAREKVELFRNYYFVNYRTFEQDEKSEDYLDPVNMYFVVFKGGVISFHFSQMPHPPHVRRRIRQLAEHQYTDSDWISYAIIDNITDAYAPLIEAIEKEVDDIDDEILRLNSRKKPEDGRNSAEQISNVTSGGRSRSARDTLQEKLLNDNRDSYNREKDDQPSSGDMDRDMLLRVGECRKRVMGLYRLLGNKADVIKGLAKRCNEQWQVAPRSDVGLYLGDIQDHIVTMTGNLTHYENILSRAHSNYLAQINIGMNERAEQTADVLGKLTVLGTIVLPMNIVTGMWGMNCIVPGQDVENLWWFFGISGFLVLFGLSSFLLAKKVYKIV